MKTKILSLLPVFLLSFLVIQNGCKKDNDNDPDQNQITNVNGSWSGKTSQNENLSFIVESNVVTTFSIKIITPGFILEITIYSSPSVTNNSFSLSTSTSTGTLYITGNFTSNTSAEGTFKLNSTEGTWTATK